MNKSLFTIVNDKNQMAARANTMDSAREIRNELEKNTGKLFSIKLTSDHKGL